MASNRSGGAIRNEGGALTISDSGLIGNSGSVGGAIWNLGSLIITDSLIDFNTGAIAGGIFHASGDLFIRNSTISRNRAFPFNGGGIASSAGTVMLINSTLAGNIDSDSAGGGLSNSSSTVVITNSTVANNAGGGIHNSAGLVTLTNSTVVGNEVNISGGGLFNSIGTLRLQNTIVANNVALNGSDCSGSVTSVGHNLIGDPTGCNITLQPSDLSGDPGLGVFVDPAPASGFPFDPSISPVTLQSAGTGRFPLLDTSQAIDAGNNEVCASNAALVMDQLGTPRRGPCDIGAVEFYPIVNDLVVLANVSTAFDATPVPGGPAGTFRITAEFTNTSTQPIGHRFAEVVEFTGGNVLLNADRGPGGVGARLTSPDSASRPLLPGATETFEFVIGLQESEPFSFFVNLLGEIKSSNSVVALLRDAQASNP